jgi:segregation and condensation protein B
MSLKSKIEAVIYASEEPVTLVQLVGLLGEEAQAELDVQASRQGELSLGEDVESEEAEPSDPDPMNAEVVEDPEVEVAEAPAEEADAGAAESAATAAGDDKAATKAREKRLREYFRSLLDELITDYANGDRGLEIREVAGGFRLATKPEYHDAVRGFVKHLKPPLKLTLQALETLAVVAYKQPVTAPEVSEIRGVDSGGVLGSLMARKLVTTAGRKQVIGRPILYKTTKDFLVRFGLKDINELPSIEEFEKMAGELADTEPVQEEIPMEVESLAPRTNRSEEGPDEGGSTLDEINAAPEATYIAHDTPEDLIADRSTVPEGHMREHADPREVEPMADVHGSQADGVPNGDTDTEDAPERPDEEAYEEGENIADDMLVDGRMAGLIPPDRERDFDPDADSPERDAEIQSEEEKEG